MTLAWLRTDDTGPADRLGQLAESSLAQIQSRESGREQLERRCALLLVVLCVLCCVWVHEGAVALERRVVDRRAKLEQLNRLRLAIRNQGAKVQDLTAADGLFPGMSVSVRDSAVGPVLTLVPVTEPGED